MPNSAQRKALVTLVLAFVLIKFAVDSNLARQFVEERNAIDGASLVSPGPPPPPAPATGQRCLGLGDDEEMDRMLGRYDMVYIMYPAKTGSSTVKEFSHECLGLSGEFNNVVLQSPTAMRDFLKREARVPPFLSSRISHHMTFERTVKNSIHNSLIVYIHREETSRFRSSIRQVVGMKFRNQTVVGEEQVLKLIERRVNEIGMGSANILNCKLYDTIADNGASVVFLHYKKMDGLLRLLTKRHCPGLQMDRVNDGSDKESKRVRLSEFPKTWMDLEDWMDAKLSLLEHTFDLKSEASCQAETRRIEHNLLGCPDETFWYASAEFS